MQNNNNACEPLKALLGWSFISNIVNTIKIDADFAHKKLRCYATKGVALVVNACSLSRSGLINCTAISEVLAFYVFQSQLQWIHNAVAYSTLWKCCSQTTTFEFEEKALVELAKKFGIDLFKSSLSNKIQ